MSDMKKVFNFVKKHPKCTLSDIHKFLGYSSRHRTARLLDNLVYFKDLKRDYWDAGGRCYIYEIATDKYNPDE